MIELPPIEHIQSNVVTYEVVQYAAKVTETPELGLYLILKQEAGKPSECNSTKDCGPFQVNRQHYNELKQFGLTEDMIIHSSLANALAAGIILKQKLKVCGARGYDWIGQIACYHSFTPYYRLKYRSHLIRHAKKILPPELVHKISVSPASYID